jgi:hypothetical protein
MDSGIARLASAVTHALDGMIVGTPICMYYEQAKGKRVDATRDLCSLDVVLCATLTGTLSSTGEPLTVVHEHITEQMVASRRINFSIPPNAEAAGMRALDESSNELCLAGRVPVFVSCGM